MLGEVIACGRAIGHHKSIAVISADQAPSIALHQSMGFVHAGTLAQVRCKFGRWLDLAYLQLLL